MAEIVLGVMPKLVCVLLFLGACAAAQTVEGVVTNTATGSGIAGVKVLILQSGNPAYSTVTDAQGHFRIEGVKNGTYSAFYSCPGDGLGDAESRRQFRVTAGADPVKLEVHMTPSGRVSGRVVDGRGNGVPGARLEFTGPGFLFSLSTDAGGKFDLREFPFSGAYTLSAVPPLGLKPPDPEPDSDRVLGWTRTFYPGVAFPEAASKILVRPGGEVLDLELKLLAVSAHAVSGVLLNPDGAPAPKVAISVGDEPDRPPRFVTESKPDGAFEFPVVVDGEWRFSAELESGGDKLRATQWVEMAGHDLENVKVRLNPPFTVSGKVVMDAPKGTRPPKPPGIFLESHGGRIRMANGMAGPGPSARADAGGHFTLPGIYPGAYRIFADELPPPYYLDAILLGDAEPATREVELSSGAIPITVVYKTNGGTVQGTAEKCEAGGVWLVPQDTAMRRRGFLRSAECDAKDRYEIDAVRPGSYYALALSGGGPMGGYEGFLNQASTVTVRAGEVSVADLRAIPRPAY